MTAMANLRETPFDALSPTHAVDPSWVKAGRVEEAGALLHASTDGKYIVQLWECRTAMELEIPGYPVDEFITVVHGTVSIATNEGVTAEYSAGDSFLIPKGFVGKWRQADRLRKYSVCYLG